MDLTTGYRRYFPMKDPVFHQSSDNKKTLHLQGLNYKILSDYLISTLSTSSESTRILPQFSQTITFLRCLISLCFCGGI